MIPFFTPAIRVMHRLRYPQKFALVGVLLLLPLLFIMSQYLASINADIAFAERERLGLDYNAPVLGVLQALQRHGVLSLDPTTLQDALNAEQAQLERAISAVDAIDRELGILIEANDDWANFKSEWVRLKNDLPALAGEDSARRHIVLSENLLSLITVVGNNSNLILDPDIDSYYLMDTVITKLPLATHYLNQIGLYGTLSLLEGTVSPENRTRLSILMNLANANLNANRTGFGYSIEYNPSLQAQIDPLLAGYVATGEAIPALVETDLQLSPATGSPPLPMTPSAFFDHVSPLAASNFAFYDGIAGQLETLLQKRIDNFQAQRNFVLLFALVALLLTVYLFVGFYLAVRETISHLELASQRMIKNELDGAVVLNSKDELAEVAVSFNAIASELIRARDQALDASRAKGTFLANMSHELRTPLNAILGFSQLLERDKKLNEDQKENVEVIGRSGEHLLALINNVLEMSKIEAGRIALNEHGFDLHRLLKGLQEMMEVRAQSKQLHLLMDLEPDVPRYYRTDESKLRQVLINLVGNAIKFTHEGGIAVRAGYVNNQLHFEIEDTGDGIAPHEIPTLFEAFVQTASGKQSKSDGTGLGLPLSRQFVRLMGGEITVMSEAGKGSIFKFNVNAALVDASDIEVTKRARRAIGLVPGQISYRILIVDDKFENRHLLGKLLKSVGFEVAEVENGQEAIAKWETWEPHLIWMDMRMPVMDGYEATKRIKATTKGQATVIIALTASVFEHERNIITSIGCDGYVAKPFREADIFDTMTTHLGVQFVYDDQQADETTPLQAKKPALTASTLASQAPEWRGALQVAALQGDAEGIYDLLKQLPDSEKAIKDGLSEMVKTYRFDLVVDLTEQAGATP